MKSARPAMLRRLARQIREIEGRDPRSRPALAVGLAGIERLFPDGQLPAGSLVEVLAASEGGGAWTFGILLASRANAGKAFVIVDGSGCLYPPAAQRLGVDLERTIIVHPAHSRDAGAALGEALRCPAVGAVLADCPDLIVRECRKLQLAAEAGGGLGVLLRPATAAGEPSFASARLLVTPVVSVGTGRRFQVEAVRCRGGKTGRPLVLEVDDATGDVRVLAGVAAATAAARTARIAK